MIEEFSMGRGSGRGQSLLVIMEAGKDQLLSLLAQVGSDKGLQGASQRQHLAVSCGTVQALLHLGFAGKDPVRALISSASLVLTILSML